MKFLWWLLGILAMFVVFFLFVLIGRIVEPLLNLLPQAGIDVLLVIGFVAFFIGMNINWYYSAYVKGTRKPWHFWVLFITTIAFALLVLWLFVIGF